MKEQLITVFGTNGSILTSKIKAEELVDECFHKMKKKMRFAFEMPKNTSSISGIKEKQSQAQGLQP